LASSKGRVSPPAMTPQARENQLTALAMDLAEQQLREGTASAQVISHFLKQGAAETELKKENLALRNELLVAQTDQIASQKKVEELYEEALRAMKTYGGNE
jgi:hypothetical protein